MSFSLHKLLKFCLPLSVTMPIGLLLAPNSFGVNSYIITRKSDSLDQTSQEILIQRDSAVRSLSYEKNGKPISVSFAEEYITLIDSSTKVPYERQMAEHHLREKVFQKDSYLSWGDIWGISECVLGNHDLDSLTALNMNYATHCDADSNSWKRRFYRKKETLYCSWDQDKLPIKMSCESRWPGRHTRKLTLLINKK